MATLQELFGVDNLMGVIQSVKSGLPLTMPEAFLRRTKVSKNPQAVWYETAGTRQTARQTGFTAPARERAKLPRDRREALCIHARESQPYAVNELLDNIADPNSLDAQVDPMGVQEVATQTKELKQRFVNLRQSAAASVLALGSINFDGEGNLMATETAASLTVDFGVPAGNQAQLDWDGNGAIIATDWDITTTDIIGHIADVKGAALKLTGYPLEYAFYGSAVTAYIAENDIAKEYLYRNASMNDQFLVTGAIPQGFAGIKNWIPADGLFFVDEDDAYQDQFDANQVSFCPSPNPEWWNFIEGTYAIPTKSTPMGANASDLLRSVRRHIGMGSFAVGSINGGVPKIDQYVFDTFLPVLNVPEAVFIATVA